MYILVDEGSFPPSFENRSGPPPFYVLRALSFYKTRSIPLFINGSGPHTSFMGGWVGSTFLYKGRGHVLCFIRGRGSVLL